MSKYFCHKCAVEIGIIPGNIDDFNPTGNDYQLEKFYKHTVPSTNPGIISVFDLSNENKGYKGYVLNTLASGCVEIDNKDRLNVVWIAGKTTGWTYRDGNFQCNDDAVKVVYHDNETKLHGFPTGSALLSSQKCINCGEDIVNLNDE